MTPLPSVHGAPVYSPSSALSSNPPLTTKPKLVGSGSSADVVELIVGSSDVVELIVGSSGVVELIVGSWDVDSVAVGVEDKIVDSEMLDVIVDERIGLHPALTSRQRRTATRATRYFDDAIARRLRRRTFFSGNKVSGPMPL